MFERFTREARAVVIGAQEEARGLRHEQIGPEHLLVSLCRTAGGPVGDSATALGLDADRVAEAVRRAAPSGHTLDADALRSVGIDLDAVAGAVDAQFGAGAFADAGRDRSWWPLRGSRFGGGHLRFTDHAKKSLELALREALRRGDREIGAAHLLLGVLRDDAPSTRRVLADLRVSTADLRVAVEERMRRSA